MIKLVLLLIIMVRFKILLILTVCVFYKCKNDKFKPALIANSTTPVNVNNCGNLGSVSYSAQVQPILNKNCVDCHNTFSGLRLSDYTHVLNLANNGQLVGSLNGDATFLQMPLNANQDASLVMDSCSVKTILNWIKQGKLNN